MPSGYWRQFESSLASPAVIDLDGDGGAELVVPRDELLVVWRIVGGAPVEAWRATTGGRIWASPVVVDLVPSRPGLEVAVASRGSIYAFDATGAALPTGTRGRIVSAVEAFASSNSANWQSERARQAAYLVFATPAFQVQR